MKPPLSFAADLKRAEQQIKRAKRGSPWMFPSEPLCKCASNRALLAKQASK